MTHPYAGAVKNYRSITELIPSHWKTGDVTLTDGGTLHYSRTDSDQPPAIMLHGFQVDGRMWLRTALEWQGSYEVIMPDIRGHGLSSPMPADLDENTLPNDIQTLMDHLQLTEAPLVIGHSMGADIAARLAAKADLRSVVLVDPALKNILAMMPPIGDQLPDYMQPVVATIQKLSSLSHQERMVAGLNLLPPGTKLWHELDYVSFVEGQSRFNVESYKRINRMGYVVESPDVIQTIHCPVHLLTAKSMIFNPDDFAEAIKIFTGNWQTGHHIHFEDSGHFIPFDQFGRFIEVINESLTSM